MRQIAKDVIICFFIAATLWSSGYFLGKSHAEVKIIKEQVEVIKYVEKKKADILARPNAGRTELLNLMRDGKL